ncbi:MAG: DNA-directed RNA polymerase subunit omega [Proteobacteria bacterium]|nr:DNA-directed RNA polymerase subunit omega [Pseudomonadota bacterium]
MSRTTITDNLPHVSSKYELGMLASQRVRDLNGGTPPIVPAGTDKPTVTALREMASGELDIGQLRHEFVQSYKDTPIVAETENIESKSEDPLLREIDAELESAIVATEEMTPAELDAELDDSTVDSGEE